MSTVKKATSDKSESVARLLEAATKGDTFEMSKILEQKGNGLSVHTTDAMARTALHAAASEGMLEAVRYLMKQGAEINAKDAWDSTALDDAIKFQHKEVESFLLSSGGQVSSTHPIRQPHSSQPLTASEQPAILEQELVQAHPATAAS